MSGRRIIKNIRAFILSLTPTKAMWEVYDEDGNKTWVRQTWGDYYYSGLRNYIVLTWKFGRRWKVK